MSQPIVVQNHSTLVSAEEAQRIVAALNQQLARDYNSSGWVKRGLARAAGQVSLLPSGQKPPAGSWSLILLDRSDQAGALGYHDDTQGTDIPYSEIFAYDTIHDGATVSGVASHEALEMLVDPFVDPSQPRLIKRPGTNDYYIVEVGDPVQGGDYDVGGSAQGMMVADFALPSWWGLSSYRPTSFKGTATEPWQIAPQGYMSILRNGKWTQVFGQERDRHPAWASRLPRIHDTLQ